MEECAGRWMGNIGPVSVIEVASYDLGAIGMGVVLFSCNSRAIVLKICSKYPIVCVKGNCWTNLNAHVFEKHRETIEKLADLQRSNTK